MIAIPDYMTHAKHSLDWDFKIELLETCLDHMNNWTENHWRPILIEICDCHWLVDNHVIPAYLDERQRELITRLQEFKAKKDSYNELLVYAYYLRLMSGMAEVRYSN